MTRSETAGAQRSFDGVWLGLLLLIALVPIPFGSNRPWAWSLMSLWVAILLVGWATMLAMGRRAVVWRKALIVPLVVVVLIFGWVLFSIIPESGLSNPVWQMATEQLGHPLPQRLALSDGAVLVSMMRLLSYVSMFWLSLQYCRSRERAEKLMVWISWSGLVIAIYGLVNYFAGNEFLLWYRRWASLPDITGTFVNRNHYATFAGFGLICAMGLGVIAFRSAWRISDRSQPAFSRGIECLIGRPLVYYVIMVVIAMAWLQTHSRMGMASVALGMFVMLILMMAVGMIRRHFVQWFIILLVGFFLLQVSGETTLARIAATGADRERAPLFAIVIDQITSAPFTGSGYGSFSQAFITYRDSRLSNASDFSAAHNSYLELAAELGIPATFLFLLGISWCTALCLIGAFKRRADRLYPIVAVAATVVLAMHSLLDFSAQIPAVALLYAAILGMGVAQSWSTE